MKYRRRMSNPAPGRKEAKRWCIIASITIIVLLTWIFFESSTSQKKSSHDWHKPETNEKTTIKSDEELDQKNNNEFQQLKNSLEIEEQNSKIPVRSSTDSNSEIYGPTDMFNMRVMWEVPEKIKGIFFLGHGCKHHGTDFWERSEFCSECLGLPEEIAIKNMGVQMGYIVIAISSGKDCWEIQNSKSDESDLDRVKNILEKLISDYKWEKYPVFAMGASSGGALVLGLPTVMKLNGVCSQISSQNLNIQFDQLKYPFPPTIFIHMPRDTNLAQKIEQSIKQLNQSSIKTLEIKHNPIPLNASFLSDRIEGFDAEKSQKIYQVWKENNFLDEKNILTKNPRSEEWRGLVRKAIPNLNDTLINDHSDIIEVLNVAYADHEIVRDYTKKVMDWFEKNMQGS